jgi:hypothetical protein
MMFRVYEHYCDEPKKNEEDNISECFICFEFKSEDGYNPICLKKQTLYKNRCICNGSVHYYCLKSWFDKNKSCPICRVKIAENNNAKIIIFNYIPCGINIYIFSKKTCLIILKIILVLLVLYTVIDLYIVLIIKSYSYKQKEVYSYTVLPILLDEDI